MKLGTQVWGLITVVVVLALVAGGYFLGVAPLLDQQAKAESLREEAEDTNAALEADIARLVTAEKKIDEYTALAEDYDALIPDTVDSQRFLRSIDAFAAANGVTVTELSIDSYIPYTAPAADKDAATSEQAPPPFTDGRITDKNFVVVPFGVTIEGGLPESFAFINALQTGDRLVLYMSIEQSTTDEAYSTVITGYMYVLLRAGSTLPGQEPVQIDGDPATPTDAETPTARG